MGFLLWMIANFEWFFWIGIVIMLIAGFFAMRSITKGIEKEEESKKNWII